MADTPEIAMGFFAKWGTTLITAAVGLLAVGAVWWYMNGRLQKESKRLKKTQAMFAGQLEQLADARAKQLKGAAAAKSKSAPAPAPSTDDDDEEETSQQQEEQTTSVAEEDSTTDSEEDDADTEN